MSRLITMYDLAREAGVSQATVSRALQGHPRISLATRDRIRALANKRGYRPDPTLSALMVYRSSRKPKVVSGKIAILLMWTAGKRGKLIEHNLDLNEKVKGVQMRARELGYEAESFFMGPDPAEQEKLSRVLYSRGIRGVIVGPVPKGYPSLTRFDWSEFSAVALSVSAETAHLHYVGQDQRSEVVYENLRKLGYRRIGFCAPQATESNYRYMKLAIYLKCLFLDGISPGSSPPLLFSDWTKCNPLPWLKRYKFDAVMTSQATAFQTKLEGSAFHVPRNLGIAALSLHANQPNAKRTTGIVEDPPKVGVAAVNLLHQLICQADRGVPVDRQAIILEGVWNPGTTAIQQPEVKAARRG